MMNGRRLPSREGLGLTEPPEADGLIITARSQIPAVGRPRHLKHLAHVPLGGVKQGATRRLPEPDGAIRAGRSQVSASRRPGHRLD